MAHRCTLHHFSLQQLKRAKPHNALHWQDCIASEQHGSSCTSQQSQIHFQLSRESTALAHISLCLQCQQLIQLRLEPGLVQISLLGDILNCLEKITCQYLLDQLAVNIQAGANAPIQEALQQRAYQYTDGYWKKSLQKRHTRYQKHIAATLQTLAAPTDYAIKHRLPVQTEPARLVSVGTDMYQREQRTTPGTARAWQLMHQAAKADQINLQLVSAFRSVEYQADIIRRKQARGLSNDAIYAVSAAPGFSEHHTGQALDLSTPNYAVLEEEFAESPAYAWLCEHAKRFGFVESFPADNIHGLVWEPWHWAWHPQTEPPLCACYANGGVN